MIMRHILCSLILIYTACKISTRCFHPLPNNEILTWTKLKAFADNEFSFAKMVISILDRVENIVGKRENAGYQHFLLFPQSFEKVFLSGHLKIRIVWSRLKRINSVFWKMLAC